MATVLEEAVTEVTGDASGDSDSDSRNFAITFRQKWSDVVGPNAVMEYCKNRPQVYPWLGNYYQYGTESNVDSICRKIEPTRDKKAPKFWFIRFSFEDKQTSGGGKQEKPDEGGRPTSDPLKWRPQYSFGTRLIAQAVERAQHLGGFTGRQLLRYPVGTWGPVVNSANVPFDPPLEGQRVQKTLKITSWHPYWLDTWVTLFEQKINSDTILFRRRAWHGILATWKPLTTAVEQITGGMEEVNGQWVWKREIEIIHDPKGLAVEVLDRGFSRSRLAGDLSEDGLSSVSPGDWDFAISSIPPITRIKDATGEPVSEPVLLDGAGQPLKNPKPDKAVYIKYLTYERAPLNLMGLL